MIIDPVLLLRGALPAAVSIAGVVGFDTARTVLVWSLCSGIVGSLV
jgi:hypothetical protein